VPRSSGSLPNTLRTLYGALTARALVVSGSDGPTLQPSLASLCTAETPSPLTIMPLLPARQPAGGTPRRATRARARAVATVGQSAQRSADRSVRRLIPRRRRTAPASRWAARPRSGSPSARQRARTAAVPCLTPSPPRGLKKEGTGAATLCPCRCFLSPPHPLEGALRIADRSWRSAAVPLLPLVLCGLSFLLASICTVMPQGSYVKARPRCWRTAVTDLCVPGDRRRIRVPDAVRARAGGPRGDNVSPHPSRVAALRCRSNGLLLPGCVLPGTRGGSRAPSPDRQPWRREPSLWPAPGSRRRLPIAAALFLPPQEAQGNPGGATSRAGLALLGAPAHP
jgi:hypothetical protein